MSHLMPYYSFQLISLSFFARGNTIFAIVFGLKIAARDTINDLIRKRINLHCIIFTKAICKISHIRVKGQGLCDSSRPGRAGPLCEAGVKKRYRKVAGVKYNTPHSVRQSSRRGRSAHDKSWNATERPKANTCSVNRNAVGQMQIICWILM